MLKQHISLMLIDIEHYVSGKSSSRKMLRAEVSFFCPVLITMFPRRLNITNP